MTENWRIENHVLHPIDRTGSMLNLHPGKRDVINNDNILVDSFVKQETDEVRPDNKHNGKPWSD